jgi:hypothetical protein
VPVWQNNLPLLPLVTSARIVSPNGDAALEFGIASITDAALTISEATALARQGALGESTPATPICDYQDAKPQAPSWFEAVRFGELVLVTSGVTLSDSLGFYPFTNLSYETFSGPSDQLDAIMKRVYLPVLFQLVSGGGGDPTPTPTPGFSREEWMDLYGRMTVPSSCRTGGHAPLSGWSGKGYSAAASS